MKVTQYKSKLFANTQNKIFVTFSQYLIYYYVRLALLVLENYNKRRYFIPQKTDFNNF